LLIETEIAYGGFKPTRRFLIFVFLAAVFGMAGLGNDPVQFFSTGLPLHWVKFTFETGFELPSSCHTLPCYATHRNRNILDFMRWPQIDLGTQDLNDIQRPNSFQQKSWK
jgi:hypothetical protein